MANGFVDGNAFGPAAPPGGSGGGKFAAGRSNFADICGVGGTGRIPICGGLSFNFGAGNGEFCALPGFCGNGGGCLLADDDDDDDESSTLSNGFFKLFRFGGISGGFFVKTLSPRTGTCGGAHFFNAIAADVVVVAPSPLIETAFNF